MAFLQIIQVESELFTSFWYHIMNERDCEDIKFLTFYIFYITQFRVNIQNMQPLTLKRYSLKVST